MASDADLAPIADMLRREIEGVPLTEWLRAANLLGIHLDTVSAIGLGPLSDLTGAPVSFEELELTDGPEPMFVNDMTSLARIADA